MERRDFLKVLGTAAGAGAAAACSPSTGGVPPERMLPYVIAEPEIVPGISTYYRTTCRECPAGCGMDVRTREGRALKAEGNPLSPISHGKLCARGQASLHGLYNPDRVPQALVRQGTGADPWKEVTWDQAEAQLAQQLAGARGRAVFLTRNYTGTLDRLAQLDFTRIVMGHGDVVGRDWLKTFRGYVHDMVAAVRMEVATGAALDEVKQRVTATLAPTYEKPFSAYGEYRPWRTGLAANIERTFAMVS